MAMDLFSDTTAILNSIASNGYYGMLRGPIIAIGIIEFKMAAVSPNEGPLQI